ncbi:unnamed protein product [Ranitomeya imitator]|uniref:Tubby N-terminal domain-containing protein n=1 Tax=Ranitomeya imitator TaxID=111125 RepID=A0ABN9KZP8_9NEOB|nr:unnamed protein product [Ranitomeya imitator]
MLSDRGRTKRRTTGCSRRPEKSSAVKLRTSRLQEDGHDVRQQKLEKQRNIHEKKQKRKRLDPLMLQANPDMKVKPRRSPKSEEQVLLVEPCTVSSINSGVGEISEEDLEETVLEDTKPLTSRKEHFQAKLKQKTKTKAGKHDAKEPKKPSPKVSKSRKTSARDCEKENTPQNKGSTCYESIGADLGVGVKTQDLIQEITSDKMVAFKNSNDEENSLSIGNRTVPPAPIKQRHKKKLQKKGIYGFL